MQKTKKSMVYTGLTILACIAMLVAATFAWFTDSVTNTGNKITAGDLKIGFAELKTAPGGGSPDWEEITDKSAAIVSDKIVWEPGYTDVHVFKVSNAGSLALKYQLDAQAENSNAIGELADVIDVYVADTADAVTQKPSDLTACGTKIGTLAEVLSDSKTITDGQLNTKDDAHYITVALHMQEEAGNALQGGTIGAFDITLKATQAMHEKDGFDNSNYDEKAEYPIGDVWDGQTPTDQPEGVLNIVESSPGKLDTTNSSIAVNSASDFMYVMNHYDEILQKLANQYTNGNKSTVYLWSWPVRLNCDIDLNHQAMAPLEFGYGSFDGQGHTIANANIVGGNLDNVGLFQSAKPTSNLNLKNISVSTEKGVLSGGSVNVGVLAGACTTRIDNVTVDGFTITAKDGKEWNNFVGGLVGNSYASASNCHIKNGTINGGENVGGMFGYVCTEGGNMLVENCSVDGVTIENGYRAGSFAARLNNVGGTMTLNNCVVTNTTVKGEKPEKIYGDIPGNPVTINGKEVSKEVTK